MANRGCSLINTITRAHAAHLSCFHIAKGMDIKSNFDYSTHIFTTLHCFKIKL